MFPVSILFDTVLFRFYGIRYFVYFCLISGSHTVKFRQGLNENKKGGS
jgi:hypothetical protein